MQLFFVTALHGITIPEDLGRGDRLDDTTFVTNNLTPVLPHLDALFVEMAGTLEFGHLSKAPALVYAIDEASTAADLPEYVLQKLRLVYRFLSALWLEKDNAVNHDVGFAFRSPTLHTNTLVVRYFDASGTSEPTTFSRTELKRARSMLRDQLVANDFLPIGSSIAVHSSGRVERALYFTAGARDSHDLGLKVANYCTALESLFASGSTELVHQLAERVAAFLEDSAETRAAVYADVKRAYAVRSTVVHGGALKGRRSAELSHASTVLDGLLRRVFRVLLEAPIQRALLNQEMDMFNRAFLLRVFGAPWEALVEDEGSGA